MKYRLVLWDFDGTLADTLTLALGIYNRMAAKKNYKPIGDPFAVRDMGMREFLNQHGIPLHRIPFAYATFLKELNELASKVVLHTGIHDVLPQISQLGIHQGVVSSNSTQNIQRCLNANEAASFFKYVSGTSRLFGKEKRIAAACRELECSAADVLYVGDEIRDIEAATAAGVDVAAVSWGLNSAELLRANSPTHLIDSPAELMKILTAADGGTT